MHIRQHQPHPIGQRFVFSSLLIALVVLYSFPLHASAHRNGGGPSLQVVQAGFSNRYRDGNWIPIQIKLQNTGPDFNGVVSINAPAPFSTTGTFSPISIYQEAVSLPSGAQKNVTLYMPFF